jgi:hypothetical protein
MRLEILAKRLADKTNTPILEQIILDEAPITDLPETCMIWTGTANHNSKETRFRKIRDTTGGTWIGAAADFPQGLIQFDGKRHTVNRLIMSLVLKPSFEFRMTKECQSPLCVNPIHWSIRGTLPKKALPPEEDTEMGINQGAWTLKEAEELIEILLTEQSPKCFEDVVNATLMEECPHDLAREVLLKLNKGHLT